MTHTQAIAIVGASESTLWTYWLMHNLNEYRYPGQIWPVNPNRETVYGLPCFPSVKALPDTPQVGVLITNPERTLQACADLVERGTPELIVVSDGFRETATAEGVERERALQQIGTANGTRIVGPNCVGYASFHDSFCAIAEPIPLGLTAGQISVISQSGVLTHTALAALKDEGLGVDVCYSIGNGATFGFEGALKALGARPTTKIICAVVESIRERDALAGAVAAGRAAGVEFVFLLLGQSEDGKRVAQSHTGAVIGDQRIMRAWLTGLGVILVNSFEELTRTAALLSVVGRPGRGRGVFILTLSGGGAGLAADTCANYGLPLAQLSDETTTKLKDHVLSGTVVGNPLDITTHGGPESTRAIYDIIGADPSVGMMLDPYGLSWPDDSDERRWHREGIEKVLEATAEANLPLIYTSLMGQPMTDYMRRLAANPRVCVNVGLATTISSLARLYDYTDLTPPELVTTSAKHPLTDGSVIDEARARSVLQALGLPVVAGFVADSPQSAADRADGLRAPWVAKIALAGLGHKGKVGGVRLGLCSTSELASACEDIVSRVTELGLASRADVGFMVQEMEFGPELLVGLVRDRVAGPSMIVGVGGWAAESANIFAAIPLPAAKELVTTELARSLLPQLIGAESTTALVDLLLELGSQFTSGALQDYGVVECNPVIMTVCGPRIADVLLIKQA